MSSSVSSAAPTSTSRGGAGRSSSYTENLTRLAHHQKSGRGIPPYSRYINRPLGRRFAAMFGCTRLSPNAVSAISFMFSAAAIVAMATVRPTPIVGVAIAATLVLGYALDSADGQLARLSGGGSVLGEWVDHTFDVMKIAGFHLALVVAAVTQPTPFGSFPAWMAGTFEFVAVTVFFVLILTDQLRRQQQRATKKSTPAGGPILWLTLPVDWGFQCLWMCTFGFPKVFWAGYAVLLGANGLYLAASIVLKARELASLDGAPS